MAQQTSKIWQTLWRTKGTQIEYYFDIDGVAYYSDKVVSINVDNGLFEQLSIGNAACAQLTLEVFADNIPRGAQIKRFKRLVNGEQVSEWKSAGVYFANRRTEDNGLWTIEAYDIMRKAEQPWTPRQELQFPLPMPDAVEEFARILGCEIDPRTQLDASYTIDYPTTDPESEEPVDNNYSIRKELQWIAAAHGGNWIITPEGKLLLVPIGGEPKETHYLVTEYGDAIVMGGVRILV